MRGISVVGFSVGRRSCCEREHTQRVADLADLRFECSLRPETMELTEHPDGPDVYQGKWDIDAANAFLTTWTVSGPRQSGNILAMLTREDLSSSDGDVDGDEAS